MKIQLDSMRETESRQATLIHTQREKLLEYETHRGNLEGSANLHELSFQALQQEHREAQQRIIDLESRLRYPMCLFVGVARHVTCYFKLTL